MKYSINGKNVSMESENIISLRKNKITLPKILTERIQKKDYVLLNGYLRLLDEPMQDKVLSLIEKYEDWQSGIPFAITAFGDVLVWDSNYVFMYKLVEDKVDVILSGFDFFFDNINDKEYQKDFFDLDLYNSAINRLGPLAKDECFTIQPLPKLGGKKEESYLAKGKFIEYLALILML